MNYSKLTKFLSPNSDSVVYQNYSLSKKIDRTKLSFNLYKKSLDFINKNLILESKLILSLSLFYEPRNFLAKSLLLKLENKNISNNQIKKGKTKSGILLIIGVNPATISFANKVIKENKVVGIIMQYNYCPIISKKEYLKNDILNHEVKNLFDKFNPKIYFKELNQLSENYLNLELKEEIPFLRTPRGYLNSSTCLNFIKKINAEILVSHGPEKIAQDILKQFKEKTINIHWGLSPYFKGMDTLRWPMKLDLKKFLGITIHQLNNKLDSGDIYQQFFLKNKEMSFDEIEYYATDLATKNWNIIFKNILNKKFIGIDQKNNFFDSSPRFIFMKNSKKIKNNYQNLKRKRPKIVH